MSGSPLLQEINGTPVVVAMLTGGPAVIHHSSFIRLVSEVQNGSYARARMILKEVKRYYPEICNLLRLRDLKINLEFSSQEASVNIASTIYYSLITEFARHLNNNDEAVKLLSNNLGLILQPFFN